ncbi:MAG: DNA internalization-related competence protein ComEC/Rec2 [Mariprofundaceae bacterium]
MQAIPLLWPALAWVMGLAVVRMESISGQLGGLLCVGLLICVLFSLYRRFAIWVLLGFCWGGLWLLYDAYLVHIDASWTQSEVAFQADIESIRLAGPSKRLRLDHIVRDDGVVLRAKLDVYTWRSVMALKPGQRIHLKAKLHAPANHYNPGGFDYEAYAFDHHLALSGSVRGSIKLLDQHVGLLNQWRESIRMSLPEQAAQRGVLQATLLGDRSQIPVAVKDAFAATGAAHLLAISGLHMGMVALWAMLLCHYFLTRRASWIVAFPVQSVALCVGLFCAVFYATLAAWPLPSQRAALMLLAAVLAWCLRARYQPVNCLLAALMLITFLDASAVLSISLWLSFLATLFLLLFANVVSASQQGGYAERIGLYIKGLLWVSLVAALATLPLTTDIFGRFPVWSLAANMVLLPLYGFWVLPWALLGEFLALLGLIEYAHDMMTVSSMAIDVGVKWLFYLQQLPAGQLWLADIPLMYGLAYGLSLIAVAWLWLQQKKLGALCLMSASLALYTVLVVVEKPIEQTQWIVWDVGQGAASSLLQQQSGEVGHVFVVDVPGRVGSQFNGGTTVASGLRMLGLNHIDVLMLSHAQSDHAGGALRLIDSIGSVGELWIADVPANHAYKPMLAAASRIKKSGGKVVWLKQGDQLNLGQARLKVLWPPQYYKPANDNNTSLVCSIELQSGQRIFVGGDMEKPVEKALVLEGRLSKHELMLMPHHGSRTSSSMALLKQLQADIVIAQTGRNNHFGFPKEDVLQRYELVQSEVWNSAGGAVFWQDGQQNMSQWQLPKSNKRHAALQYWDLLL